MTSFGNEFYLVGGAVRDLYLGRTPNDFDFVVQADNFNHLIELCKSEGFLPVPHADTSSGFVEFPDTLGLKATDPILRTVVDIHAARKEFDYRDRRHPSKVEVGNIEEDVCRRDFTANALLIARSAFFSKPFSEKLIIDLVGGIIDIESEKLKTVGDAVARFTENPDRVIRAFRFACKYNWDFDDNLESSLNCRVVLDAVRKENDDVKFKSLNRILYDREGLGSFFSRLNQYPQVFDAIFSNVGLMATNRKDFI